MNHPPSYVLASLAFAALLGSPGARGEAVSSPDSSIRTVAVSGEALVVRDGRAPLRTLLSGGPERSQPVWSADGRRIAFLQTPDKARALDDLVVVEAESGKEVMRAPVEPVIPNFHYTGMRFVEHVQWISADRIMVSGSFNPSQSQYYVFDAKSGAQIVDFVDDDSSAAYSPDGMRLASISGSPHFGGPDVRKPVLSIDDRPVFPTNVSEDGVTDFLSAPSWSPDGKAIAIAARDRAHGAAELIIWREASVQKRAVPFDPNLPIRLVWSGGQILALPRLGEPGRAWYVDGTTLAVREARDELASTDLRKAEALRAAFAASARKSGLTEPDFWCGQCLLKVLPRASASF